MAAPNPERQRASRQTLTRLLSAKNVWVIHYACQSFSPGDAIRSPRVTAIVARNLASSEIATFSLHIEAEFLKLNPVGVLARLDHLERNMLDKFFAFLKDRRHDEFLHWKMQSATYGFEAIEHRYTVLGGTPTQLPELQRHNLAELLEEIYGVEYVEAPHFERLAKLNKIPLSGFLPGTKEADAFRRSRYFAIQRSISAKVALLSAVARRAHDGKLRTDIGRLTQVVHRAGEHYLNYRNDPTRAVVAAAGALLTIGFTVWKLVTH